MKNYSKIVFGFLFIMMTVVLFPTTSKAIAAPVNVCQTEYTGDVDGDAVTITWNAVPGVTDYYVQCCDDADWGDTKERTFLTTYRIYNLNSGVSKYVRVGVLDLETGDYVWSEPIEVVTAPKAATITQLEATVVKTDSLTFTWNPCAGATSYNILDYSSDELLGTTTDTTFTWNGLAPNSQYGIKVVPVRTSKSGFAAYEDTNFLALKKVSTAKTAPAAPKNKSYIESMNTKSMTVSFYAYVTGRSQHADGYEVEVYDMKDGKKVETLSADNDSETKRMKVTEDTLYKYRIRYYVVNNGQNLYGAWSGYRHFCMQKVTIKKSCKANRLYETIKVSWKKVAGVSGYTIYISESEDGKYKKIKSLGKNIKGITIKKIGKSKLNKMETYYVKIVPEVKDDKKTIMSDTQTVAATPATSKVTERSVYAILKSLRSTYPEGKKVTNTSYFYFSPEFGNGVGCYGFAAKLSDTVFGTEKAYKTHSSFSRIKVGDNIRIGGYHSVIVLTKKKNYITVVEGNYNGMVHWNRKITSSSLTSSGFKVYTRY